jgi:ectoine hydroxylase-related dioxygenase (phytanoyl-CoA dioxygenase family)
MLTTRRRRPKATRLPVYGAPAACPTSYHRPTPIVSFPSRLHVSAGTELAPSYAEAGVLGVLPGIVGSIQAVEAI